MFALERRGQQRSINIWPGFVDGLASLLLVVIFVLMVFMVAQYFLSTALTGRDAALQRLQRQVAELAELLALERAANFRLQSEVDKFSSELQSSLLNRESLSDELGGLIEERDQLRNQLALLTQGRDELERRLEEIAAERALSEKELADAYKVIEADKEKIEAQLAELAVLKSLRDEMAAELAGTQDQLSEESERAKTLAASLAKEEEVSAEAARQVALLNRQILALRQQLAQLSEALEASEAKNKEQEVQIADLGRRLNVALATKVQELARYRSEFFGRLRQVLGDRQDIRVVGDRFVFQSEILFESASAELGDGGKVQMRRLAKTLAEISAEIPDEIDWVLRVDGHTDIRPISTAEFPSNWELSTARAISVVQYLIDEGIPARRLAATGFGQYQPIDDGRDEIALRRNRRIELKLTQR